jgi:MoaA/NifB/PqqE/SkfB family radical SAM enzyme
MQLVTDKVIELLYRIDEVHIQASIDGTYELYDWIRGGHFDKTVDNINRYHSYGGRDVMIVATISIYNWMHVTDLIDYWKDIKGVPRINIANLVTFPKYCSPLYLKPHHIKEGKDKIYKYLNNNFTKRSDSYYTSDELIVMGINNINSVVHTIDDIGIDAMHERMIDWINFSLIARQNNEDIFELAPYLNEYKNTIVVDNE